MNIRNKIGPSKPPLDYQHVHSLDLGSSAININNLGFLGQITTEPILPDPSDIIFLHFS
jgi:hypothetical protein